MSAGPVPIKLRCASWGQLSAIYRRDLARSAIFLKAQTPPPIGTKMVIHLTLPSDTLIVLQGSVAKHIPPGGLDGRGPGVDVQLHNVPQSAMWLIESALAAVKEKDDSSIRPLPQAAVRQAERQGRAPVTVRPGTAPIEPSLEDGRQLVDAEGDLVGALQSELASLRKLNPFQLLGVPYDTTDEAVRAAFAALTKRYHPDRFARFQSPDARGAASEIFLLIRDAYRRLGSPAARSQTLRGLRQAPAPEPSAVVAPPAAVPTPDARAARPPSPAPADPRAARPPSPTPAPEPAGLRAARPPAPEPAGLRAARPPAPEPAGPRPVRPPSADPAAQPIDLPPARITTQSHNTPAALIDAGKYDQALSIFFLAAKRNPADLLARAGVELCHGLKALAEGDRLESAQRFEAVLELDPTNERAARELAEMRRQATSDRKGLLARLLGKKE